MPLSSYITALAARVDAAIDANDSNANLLIVELAEARLAAGGFGSGGGGGGAGQYYPPPLPTTATRNVIAFGTLATVQTIAAAAAGVEFRSFFNNTNADILLIEGSDDPTLTDYDRIIPPGGAIEYNKYAGEWMGITKLIGRSPTIGSLVVSDKS